MIIQLGDVFIFALQILYLMEIEALGNVFINAKMVFLETKLVELVTQLVLSFLFIIIKTIKEIDVF